jgi:beta-glucosidase
VADFAWAVGIEDTFIGQPSGRRGRILDEYALIDHYSRWRGDLDLVATLGVRTIRYGIPWYRVNPAPGAFDFTWTDELFEHLDRRRLRPIIDLVHYGTPLWLRRSFVDQDYPERVAEYAAAMAERYGALVAGWTPLNEPVVNADFSGRRGVWPPHLRGQVGYDRVLVGIAEGVARTINAIRAVDPAARIVAVEPCDLLTTEDPTLEETVQARWDELFLPLDLVLGRVDDRHPLNRRLIASGIDPERLAALRSPAPHVDVVGVNFYPHMSRAVLTRKRDGGVRRRNRYASADDLARVLTRFHARTGRPVMLTETSDNAPLQRRARWMDASVAAMCGLLQAGIPVVGYTWFPVLSHVDWRWRRGPHERSRYWCHMGFWDLDDELNRRPTPLVDQYSAFVTSGAPTALGEP